MEYKLAFRERALYLGAAFKAFNVNTKAGGSARFAGGGVMERSAGRRFLLVFPRRRAKRSKTGVAVAPEMLGGIVKVLDVGAVVGMSAAVFAFYFGFSNGLLAELERYLLTSALGALLFVAGFQYIEGYEVRQLTMLNWQLVRVAAVWAITISVLLLLAFVCKLSETYSRIWVLGWSSTTLTVMLTQRAAVRFLIALQYSRGIVRNIAIVGAGEDGALLIRKLQNSQHTGIAIHGLFDDRMSRVAHSICGHPRLGNTDDLLQFARQVPLDELIIALPLSAKKRLKAIYDKLKVLPADLRLSAESMGENFPLRGITYLAGVPLVEIAERPIKHWNALAKWSEDKLLSALLLLLFAPTMVLIALLIKLESRGPVLFRQERFGFNNKPIAVLKFRTMYADLGDVSGAHRTLRDDRRVTRVGRLLRRLSLDELPQLINVLKGDMSLVGPRPHPIAMRAGDRLYGEAIRDYVNRHRVKPGITGWAQVNGFRGEVDSVEKARARLECDLFYIDHWSLWLDLKTLILTVPILLSRQNAY